MLKQDACVCTCEVANRAETCEDVTGVEPLNRVIGISEVIWALGFDVLLPNWIIVHSCIANPVGDHSNQDGESGASAAEGHIPD